MRFLGRFALGIPLHLGRSVMRSSLLSVLLSAIFVVLVVRLLPRYEFYAVGDQGVMVRADRWTGVAEWGMPESLGERTEWASWGHTVPVAQAQLSLEKRFRSLWIFGCVAAFMGVLMRNARTREIERRRIELQELLKHTNVGLT